MNAIFYPVTNAIKDNSATQCTQAHHRLLASHSHALCPCVAVILMNDWRQLCWGKDRLSKPAEPLWSLSIA